MAFQFSERHIEEFYTLGYTIFDGVLPDSLIADLRRAAETGRTLARAKNGPQAQRFQPVAAFAIDQKPFEDYRNLAPLREAVAAVLSPQHSYGNPRFMGVLLEPADLPYTTGWHRDFRDNLGGFDASQWDTMLHRLDIGNQINCALYEDSCTWYVPGSHWRPDLPRESALFPTGSIRGPELEGYSLEERERIGVDYCRSMPGAVRVDLAAGDFMLYRSFAWHLGNYIPYQKRATLHDGAMTPEGWAWIGSQLKF